MSRLARTAVEDLSRVSLRWRNTASMTTLKTGEVKASTIRSPMGMRRTATTQTKLMEAVRRPRRLTRPHLRSSAVWAGARGGGASSRHPTD